MIATIGDQTADIQNGPLPFVAPHGAVAFLDPPANGAFAGIVGAIQDFIAVGILGTAPETRLPGTIKGQARPENPAVQEEVAQPISQAGHLPGTRGRGPGVAQV